MRWTPQCLACILIVSALGVEMGRIEKLQMCLRNMFGLYLGLLRECRYQSQPSSVIALIQASLIQPPTGTGLGPLHLPCEVFPWGRVISEDG